MHKPAIIVAGMGRCGSSLTMQMLHRAGVPCVGDFPAFETAHSSLDGFHPDYFAGLSGIAIKLLDPMMHALPVLTDHVVIWLDRNSKDQADSIAKFLTLEGVKLDRAGRRTIASSLRTDRNPNLRAFGAAPMLVVNFANLINPCHLRGALMIRDFLKEHGWDIDFEKMRGAIIKRAPACLDGFLEQNLLEGMAA